MNTVCSFSGFIFTTVGLTLELFESVFNIYLRKIFLYIPLLKRDIALLRSSNKGDFEVDHSEDKP